MALIGFLNQRHNSCCYLTTAPTKLQHSGLCKSEFLKYWQIKKISSRGWFHTFPLQPLKVWCRLAQPYASLLETHNRIQCVYTSKARCARLWIKILECIALALAIIFFKFDILGSEAFNLHLLRSNTRRNSRLVASLTRLVLSLLYEWSKTL